MNFDDIVTEQPVVFSESLVRDKTMIVKNKTLPNNNRITQLVSNYKRGTMNSEEQETKPERVLLQGNRQFGKSEIQFNPNQLTLGLKGKSNSIMRKTSIQKISYSKNLDIDYNSGSLMESVVEYEDPFSAYIILQSFKFCNIMIQTICSNVKFHNAFAQSGLLWKMLLHLMNDYSQCSLKIILDPDQIDKTICGTIRLFLSYCKHLEENNDEDKLLSEDEIREQKYNLEVCNALKQLLKPRLYDKLICHFKFKEENVLEIDDKDISIFFLEMYRSVSIQSPDLIWNNSIKGELKSILLKEIEL